MIGLTLKQKARIFKNASFSRNSDGTVSTLMWLRGVIAKEDIEKAVTVDDLYKLMADKLEGMKQHIISSIDAEIEKIRNS